MSALLAWVMDLVWSGSQVQFKSCASNEKSLKNKRLRFLFGGLETRLPIGAQKAAQGFAQGCAETCAGGRGP
ncbi:hypothetical protein F3I16_01650 [Pseudomonas sp. L-22-4S-12]|uniref:hypothetical protein n=1 Tax=Pseudomonas sp. L-22-4S-12 TaxID=2610893 RepID=UPI0013247699|nr:hypothetical protein [Pseudomonas sp. L-22-4S-12]MWV14736.1 hypothetical protein [Pseudomonas sp. L-22-4S-12]